MPQLQTISSHCTTTTTSTPPPPPPPLPGTFYLSRLCINLPSLKKLHASFLIHDLTNGTPSVVVSLHHFMHLSLHPTPHDDVLFSVVFKSCAESYDLHNLTITHCHVIKSLPSDCFVLSCAKCAASTRPDAPSMRSTKTATSFRGPP
ncbi:hypothetical protein AAZV13_20G022800 [Glycine max]